MKTGLEQLEPKSLLSAANAVETLVSAAGGADDAPLPSAEDADETFSYEQTSPIVSVSDSYGEENAMRAGAEFDAVVRVNGSFGRGTGALVAPDLVITAWHIGVKPGHQVAVSDNGNVMRFKVKEVIDVAPGDHINWADGRDIVLLRLEESVPHDFAQPMKLVDATQELVGQEATIVGFGYNGVGSTGTGGTSTGGRWAGRNVIDGYEMFSWDANLFHADFDNGTEAANRHGVATPLEDEAIVDRGDSGGPLLVAVDGEWMIAGIASGAIHGGRYGATAVWTGVSPFRAVIEDAGGVFESANIGKLPGVRVTNGDFESGAPASGRNKKSIEGWIDGDDHSWGVWADTWHTNANLPGDSGAAAGLTGGRLNTLEQSVGHKLPWTTSLDFSVDLLSFTDVRQVRSGELTVEVYQRGELVDSVPLTARLWKGQRETLVGRLDVSSADSSDELITQVTWDGQWMALDNFTLSERSAGVSVTNGDFESGAPRSGRLQSAIEGWNDGDNRTQARIYSQSYHTSRPLSADTGSAAGMSIYGTNILTQNVGTKLSGTNTVSFSIDVLGDKSIQSAQSGKLQVRILQGEQRTLIDSFSKRARVTKDSMMSFAGQLDVSAANNVENLHVELIWKGGTVALDNFALTEGDLSQTVLATAAISASVSPTSASPVRQRTSSVFSRLQDVQSDARLQSASVADSVFWSAWDGNVESESQGSSERNRSKRFQSNSPARTEIDSSTSSQADLLSELDSELLSHLAD